MKKSTLKHVLPGTAEYVIAHAAWQRGRGRNPSEPFGSIRNPRRALCSAQLLVKFNYWVGRVNSAFQPLYDPPETARGGVLRVRALWGADLIDAIYEGVELARYVGVKLAFEGNGVDIRVDPDSDPSLIFREWSRATKGYIEKKIGPHPTPVLTDEEKASDARIEAVNERRRQERQAQYEAKDLAKKDSVETKLAGAPPMEVSDERLLEEYRKKNPDGYGIGIMAYAERWARLMQLEIAGGKSLEEVAETTSHEADTDGITGYMYGCAVATLAGCWSHGDQLRRWHNKKHGIEEGEAKGGVVNPVAFSLSAG